MESKVAPVTPSPTIHLEPTAPLAERVLLPGDPARALMLAQTLLESPKMFNHNRGLWGYTGLAQDGHELTIQSSGMGGPSAAIVVEELVMLGARRIVRVGTCGALERGLGLGELLVATGALCEDGTSRAISGADRVAADPSLAAALAEASGGPSGDVASVDLFYEEHPVAAGRPALAVEMEAATLFALAAARGFAAAALLVISDTFSPAGARERITPDALREAAERAGRAAARALAG
jgi:DeoD family purine-nucleoside phosphorylase